jgi:hypothetical protein
MGKSIAEISEALFTDGNPQVQESEFKHVWLPLIAGLSGPAPIERWMHIAGSPFAEVDVFNGNEFLFTVPPLLSSDESVTEPLKKLSVNAALDVIQLHYNYHPNIGRSKMDEMLMSKIGKGSAKLDYAVRLNAIFKRYGLPEIPIQGVVKDVVNNQDTASPAITSADFEEL